MKKLFVTDMDGTLLNAQKELPADFPQMVEELKQDGSYFAFASGRSYLGLQDRYGSYSDDFGYICDNGGMVAFHDEVLKKVTLTRQNLRDIQNLLDLEPKLAIIFCGARTMYLMHREPLDEVQAREVRVYYVNCREVSSVDEIEEDIIKAALLYDDIEKNFLPKIQLDDSVVWPVTGFNWIDVMRSDINKGGGIAALQERLGVTPENTYVFGDYYNDLSMMDAAGTGFAMKDAVQEVKERYTEIIGSNEDGAVTSKIREILKEGREA